MRNRLFGSVSLTAAIFFAFLFIVSEYGNNALRRQIVERDVYLNHLDSIIGFYSNVSYEDSFIIFNYAVDRYGNRLKYDELDSIRHMNERIIFIQDNIIKFAKQKYKFNYSTKMRGDSLFIRVWDK